MRQRLAETLGKNRSFISLISNPTYPDADSRAAHRADLRDLPLLAARARALPGGYRTAHPRRLQLLKEEHDRMRQLTVTVPDLGTDARNRRLEAIVKEFADKVARLLRES